MLTESDDTDVYLADEFGHALGLDIGGRMKKRAPSTSKTPRNKPSNQPDPTTGQTEAAKLSSDISKHRSRHKTSKAQLLAYRQFLVEKSQSKTHGRGAAAAQELKRYNEMTVEGRTETVVNAIEEIRTRRFRELAANAKKLNPGISVDSMLSTGRAFLRATQEDGAKHSCLPPADEIQRRKAFTDAVCRVRRDDRMLRTVSNLLPVEGGLCTYDMALFLAGSREMQAAMAATAAVRRSQAAFFDITQPGDACSYIDTGLCCMSHKDIARLARHDKVEDAYECFYVFMDGLLPDRGDAKTARFTPLRRLVDEIPNSTGALEEELKDYGERKDKDEDAPLPQRWKYGGDMVTRWALVRMLRLVEEMLIDLPDLGWKSVKTAAGDQVMALVEGSPRLATDAAAVLMRIVRLESGEAPVVGAQDAMPVLGKYGARSGNTNDERTWKSELQHDPASMSLSKDDTDVYLARCYVRRLLYTACSELWLMHCPLLVHCFTLLVQSAANQEDLSDLTSDLWNRSSLPTATLEAIHKSESTDVSMAAKRQLRAMAIQIATGEVIHRTQVYNDLAQEQLKKIILEKGGSLPAALGEAVSTESAPPPPETPEKGHTPIDLTQNSEAFNTRGREFLNKLMKDPASKFSGELRELGEYTFILAYGFAMLWTGREWLVVFQETLFANPNPSSAAVAAASTAVLYFSNSVIAWDRVDKLWRFLSPAIEPISKEITTFSGEMRKLLYAQLHMHPKIVNIVFYGTLVALGVWLFKTNHRALGQAAGDVLAGNVKETSLGVLNASLTHGEDFVKQGSHMLGEKVITTPAYALWFGLSGIVSGGKIIGGHMGLDHLFNSTKRLCSSVVELRGDPVKALPGTEDMKHAEALETLETSESDESGTAATATSTILDYEQLGRLYRRSVDSDGPMQPDGGGEGLVDESVTSETLRQIAAGTENGEMLAMQVVERNRRLRRRLDNGEVRMMDGSTMDGRNLRSKKRQKGAGQPRSTRGAGGSSSVATSFDDTHLDALALSPFGCNDTAWDIGRRYL